METSGAALTTLDYLGTFAFALSGALKAARKEMDAFGLVVLAGITAVGGGTLRDLIIARPVFWLADWAYIALCVLAALLVLVVYRWVERGESALLVLDALGLAVFTVIGTSKALNAGVTPVASIALGCMTGVGGGIIRDVLAGDVPLVLRREIYASASILGATALWGMETTGVDRTAAVAICGAIVFLVRIVAVHYGLGLPHPRSQPPSSSA